MNWLENIRDWRSLPSERKLRIRKEAIPHDVADSMAFERELVPVEKIREILDRTERPATSKRRKAS